MCIACHYHGDNGLVLREQRADAHGDGDWHCIRALSDGKQLRCVDCGHRLDASDVRTIGGVQRLDHLCARVLDLQVFSSRGPAARERAG